MRNQGWLALAALIGCSSDSGNMQGPGGGAPQQPLDPSMQPPGTPGGAGSGAVTGMQAGSAAPPPNGMPGAAGAGMVPDPMPGAAGTGAPAPSGDCATQGIDLEGLVYSPGGTALPHPCEPFHPTTNNPYAVRCIDAWPGYDTGFPGDEYCILPPPPDKGVQIGVHPQGKEWFAQVSTGDLSGYENPDTRFLTLAGSEEEVNYITGATNAEAGNYYRSYVRMRAGSHHMIVYHGASSAQQEVWGPGGPQLGGNNRVPGAQRPDQNTPVTLEKPAEDAGLYSVFPAMPSVTYNMHHFNATDENTLKENWTNLWWETEDARISLEPISAIDLGILVTPGQTVDLHNVFSISQSTRVVDLFGHRHAWTPNFSAWVDRAGGETEILYQSFNWFDQPTFRYDSIAQNPAIAPEQKQDGAVSGPLMLEPGDTLHFNCHIAFTDEQAAATGAPTPAEVGLLRFANEAYTAEMCILFGTTAGVRLPLMSRSTEPAPPDFATID
jgi:hypothetical protein